MRLVLVDDVVVVDDDDDDQAQMNPSLLERRCGICMAVDERQRDFNRRN